MNEDTLAGKLKSVGGKIKQAAGEAVGNQELANSGAADRVKGATQETWGTTKDAAHDLGAATTAETNGTQHTTRSGIAETAEHVKDSIRHGIDDLKDDLHHNEREVHQVQ